MSLVLLSLVLIIAFEHAAFMVLEIFFWRKPVGLKIFKRTQQQADDSAGLAANQGLYNGFLAAGLLWSLCADPTQTRSVQIFFLTCVALAGLVGGLTSNRKILVVQMGPALLALLLLFLA